MDSGELVARALENLQRDFTVVKDEVHANSERLAAFMQRQADHEEYARRLERDMEGTKVKLAELEGRVKTLEELKAGVSFFTRAVPYIISVGGAVIAGLAAYFFGR